MILRFENNQWHVYFADLKSTRVEPVNILKKLRASQLFFDYLLSISEFEKQWDEIISASYEAHYVVVHDGAKKDNKSRSLINKNPTNAKNTNSYIHEHKTLKLAVVPVNVLEGGKARVSFNKIALLFNQ